MTVLINEDFEGDLSAWYDDTSYTLTTGDFHTGAKSLLWDWTIGQTSPQNRVSMRKLFAASDQLYVSFYVKHETGWQGSAQDTHPHLTYILSDKDGTFQPLANGTLVFYIEDIVGTSGAIVPHIVAQDSQMVDVANIGVDLSGVTENRSVMSANGVQNTGGQTVDGVFGGPDHFFFDPFWYSSYSWNAPTVRFNENQWDHVEVFVKLNSIIGGIGQVDGKIRMWVNAQLAITNDAVILRTGAHSPRLRFNQYVLAPFMGVASPITQSMWLDDLLVQDVNPRDAVGSFSAMRSLGNKLPRLRSD